MSTSPKASSSLNTAADPTTSSKSTIELVQSFDPGSEPIEGSDEHLRKCLKNADELKQEGTEHFKAERWAEARASYVSALGRLPKRRIAEPKATVPDPEENAEREGGGSDKGKGKEKEEKELDEQELKPLTGLQLECAKARAILNANIGACHVKLEEYKDAVTACTEALADDPNYVKALQRRATCNEKIGSWTSLVSAQDDYNTLLKILPPTSPQIAPTQRSLTSIKPRAEAAQKKETEEVMTKLKGLGNSLLGNFGLSTDNFKFEPDGKGGYSMNFVR